MLTGSTLILFAFESRAFKSRLLSRIILDRAENGLVICVDCTGDISRRIASLKPRAGSKDLRKSLRNVIIFHVYDFDEQERVIINIVTRLASSRVDTLIVDPITYHYRVAASTAEGIERTHELNNQLGLLKVFAHETGSRVIVTSLLVSDPESGKLRLTASNILTYWSDTFVAFIDKSAYILKHPYLPKVKLKIQENYLSSM